MGDIDNAEYTGFELQGEKSFQTLLQRVIDLELIEPEILSRWNSFVKSRSLLADNAVTIAVSPMVALASDKRLLQAGKDYIDAYSELSAAVRDRYETVASQSATGARHLCAQLIVLDTIDFETAGCVYAILSPLHPLHLWKYVRSLSNFEMKRGALAMSKKRYLPRALLSYRIS